MEKIVRNVSDLPANDRSAAEQLVGHELTPDQQLVIVVQYQNGNVVISDSSNPASKLPEWCNVYKGMSDQEVGDLERVILTRADLSRPTE